jgi:hypothetical protein
MWAKLNKVFLPKGCRTEAVPHNEGEAFVRWREEYKCMAGTNVKQ